MNGEFPLKWIAILFLGSPEVQTMYVAFFSGLYVFGSQVCAKISVAHIYTDNYTENK